MSSHGNIIKTQLKEFFLQKYIRKYWRKHRDEEKFARFTFDLPVFSLSFRHLVVSKR